MNQTPKRRKSGWGKEVSHAFSIIGRVLFKTLGWLVNILITVLLIGVITGIIVGSAFAIYVKNFGRHRGRRVEIRSVAEQPDDQNLLHGV